MPARLLGQDFPRSDHRLTGFTMDRTAIVTGAGRGIGAGIADRLDHNGWRVVRLDIESGDGILTCDVSDPDDVSRTVTDLALGRLDLLVNNAGVAGAHAGPMEDLPLEDWHHYLGTNLTGPFVMSRACLPALRAARGAIVNITSTRAFMSEPDTEAYAASKGGLTALTHAMAISLGPDVRVNAVAPGWIDVDDGDLRDIDHDQHPAGRVGTPSDIAEAVVWLANAPFVTGQSVIVDGGMSVKMIYAE